MAIDQGVLDAVATANFKTLAEAPAINYTAHQQRLQLISEASLGNILNNLNNLDPAEATAVGAVNSSQLGEKISQLGASVAGLQQIMKGAQTTPPVTG